MGLGLVELVMEIEDEFGITIPDEEASRIETVGQTFDYLLDRLGYHDPVGFCVTAAAFYRLRRAAVAALSVDRKAVTPRTLFDTLIPLGGRPARWRALAAACDWPLPPLGRPRLYDRAANVGLVTLILAAGAAKIPLLPWPALLILPAAVLAVGWGMVLSTCLRAKSQRDAFPENCKTVGMLVRSCAKIKDPEREWLRASGRTRQDVWDKLVEIVSEQLGVDRAAVTPQSHYIRDFGAD